ncbi:MAG: GSCFA domain-containing protein [Cytophagales bacterium]|nr:GSCFA domain-containing protein [Cytophagales bacterium]
MFKLNFDIPPLSKKIDLKDSILMLGSCFVDSIGAYLHDHKFEVSVNPLGTLFNPISIFNSLNITLGKQSMQPIQQRNDLFFSWDTHSRWSAKSKGDLQSALASEFKVIASHIKKAQWIMITLGTAHVYEWNASGQIVANCHKFPQQDFSKRLLSAEEISQAFHETQAQVKAINPEVQWLLTVSPVRHIKDGLIENNRSKSILIQSISAMVHEFDHCHYFPAYEIMMDELRDYRFYKEDMIHPNDQAIRYIWEAFQEASLNERTKVFCDRWSKLLSALRHRPIHSGSTDHQLFLNATRRKLKELENMVDITAELEIIDAQIQA